MKKSFSLSVASLAACLVSLSLGQDSDSASSVSVLRSQAGSIANEIIDSLSSGAPSTCVLSVEGALLPGVVENAFVNACVARGVAVRVGRGGSQNETRVDIVVLEQLVRYIEASNGGYERTVTSTFEIRVDSPDLSEQPRTRVLSRTATDHVVSRESIPELGTVVEDEPESVFEHILAPVVVVAGSIVIIYLFFTVRS